MQNICLGALVVTHAMLRRLTSRRCYLFAVPYKIYSSPQLQAINIALDLARENQDK